MDVQRTLCWPSFVRDHWSTGRPLACLGVGSLDSNEKIVLFSVQAERHWGDHENVFSLFTAFLFALPANGL